MSARTCASCGRTATADQNFCANCGAALAAPPPPPPPPAQGDWAQPQTGWAQPDPAAAAGTAAAEPEGYQPGMTVLAVLLTIFAPLIALIAALVMRSGETNPVKQAFLKTWAWIAGGIVILYTVLFIAFFFAVAQSVTSVSSNGPCEGGPVLNVPGEPVGDGKYRFPCAGGGSTIVRLP